MPFGPISFHYRICEVSLVGDCLLDELCDADDDLRLPDLIFGQNDQPIIECLLAGVNGLIHIDARSTHLSGHGVQDPQVRRQPILELIRLEDVLFLMAPRLVHLMAHRLDQEILCAVAWQLGDGWWVGKGGHIKMLADELGDVAGLLLEVLFGGLMGLVPELVLLSPCFSFFLFTAALLLCG